MDEVGFNVSMRTRRGRSLRGLKAVQIVPGLRTRNISVYCAITKSGISKYSAQTSAFNSNSFLQFIEVLLEKIDSNGFHKSLIIMDNVPFHKNKAVEQKILDKGHALLFLHQ